MKTLQDLQNAVGKQFGEGKNARVITRLDGSRVFWKRPGGKERKVPQYWTYFVEWAGQLNRFERFETVADVENGLSDVPDTTSVKGWRRKTDTGWEYRFTI